MHVFFFFPHVYALMYRDQWSLLVIMKQINP